MPPHLRSAICLALLAASAALAAPPANDFCPGAYAIAPAGPFPYLTPTVPNLDEATDSASDPSRTCQPNVSRSVWYTFSPSVSGIYAIASCADAPTASTVDDTVIAVYTSAGGCAGPFTQLTGGCDDDGCNTKNFQSFVGGLSLTANTTYYVVAWTFGTGALAAGNTTLQLSFGKTASPANDLCGAATAVQLDLPVTGATSGGANDYQLALAPDGGQVCSAGLGNVASAAIGRDVTFSFTPASSGKYSWRVRGSGTEDLVLHVADSCPAGSPPLTVNSCVAMANRNSSSSTAAEEVSCVQLSAGTPYFGFVDGHTLAVGSAIELEVNACVAEVESNNTPATANPLACGLTGSSFPAGDVDFVNLGAASGRVFAMVDGLAGGTYDFDLRVTTATDVLEYDDLDGDSAFGLFAPVIAGTVVTGQSYLRVTHFQGTEVSAPWRLYAVVQPPSASATPEVEPNGTPATATAGGNHYFSGALTAPAPSQDADLYAVSAAAGDLLFVALDGDPVRNNTPLNAKLELLSPAGAVLLTVNDSHDTSNVTLVPNDLAATTPHSPGEALTWRVRTPGTYFVRVSVGNGGAVATTGDYLLSIAKNCQRSVPGPAPVLTAIAPATGPIAGGTTVTLTGTGFSPTATVSLGAVACAPATVTGTTSISCPTAARATPGAVDAVVTNADGQKATLAGGFTYFAPAPTLTAVTPNEGLLSGMTAVSVIGTGFYAGAVVTFAGVPATSGVVASSTAITAQTPAGSAAGLVEVRVTNADGQQAALANGFTYTLPPPTLTQVTPPTGSTLGGTAVTVTGTSFQPGATVSFDGFNGTVTNTTATSIAVTTPAHAAGPVMVLVRNPDAQTVLLSNAFTYVAPPAPTVTSVVPGNGLASGGTGVTLTGTWFAAGAGVQFGGVNASNVIVTSATSLTATTPAHLAGVVDVVVRNVDNQSGTLTNGFTFLAVPAPALTLVTPGSGAANVATAVSLSGSNFQNGATVSFGGAPATAISVVSVSQITCSTPALAAGAVDVVVRNPDNQTALLMNGFTFVGSGAGGGGGAGGGSGGSGGGSAGGSGGGSGGGSAGGSGGGAAGGSAGGGSGGAGGGGGAAGGAGGSLDGGTGGGSIAPKSGCGCNQADGGSFAFLTLLLGSIMRGSRATAARKSLRDAVR